MDEPIDAVALGLKRGPRGAAGVALLVVVGFAITLGASRWGDEPRVTAEQADPSEPVAVVPTPLSTKRPRVKRGPPPKPQPAVTRTAREAPTRPPFALTTAAREAPQPPAPVIVQSEPAAPERPEAEPPPPAPLPEPSSATELPERDGNGEAIARAIAADKRAAVRACFESELKQTPKLRGTVVVELDLAPPNRVQAVRVNDDLERVAFTNCVTATMRDVRFAALDEEISVSVPYVLTPAAK